MSLSFSAFTHVMGYALIPTAATLVGGAVALVRPPSHQLRSAIQHFAAGVLFAAVAAEVLPDVMHRREPIAATIGFAIGVALVLGMRELTEKAEGQRTATRMVVMVGVDLAIDGLLVGVGFAAGARQGALLTAALTLEVLLVGLSVAASLGASGASRKRGAAIVAGLALLLASGAAVGALLLGNITGPVLEGVLAFGCAAVLYLVTEELLVEAHEVPETPLTTAVFFAGFLLLMIVEMVT